MKKIALLPGGFKPPHAGHYNMAKWLATNTDADSVVIRVGSKEREGITREISLALWDLYIKDDENIIVKASIANSPVRDVYDFIEQEAPEGSTVYLGMGEKDINDKRFANIGKFAEPRNIKFKTVLVPPQAGGISGTQMREFINKGDKINFQKFIPDHVNKDQAWNIVTNLEEDLYNPNDHYRDFAKSSEWKAGYSKEDDIEPGYKYRRGGMYSGGGMGFGGMYETRGGEQELHIYDFDETIARVETAIPYTVKSPDGKIIEKGETTSVNFEEKQNKLENDYDKGVTIDFDFGAFEKQIENAIINEPVYNKLLNSLKSSNVKTTVLTARSIGHPVTRYLKSIGLEVYVVPLGLQVDGKVTGQDKANWIDKRIKKTTKRVYFIDDSKNNRIAVNLLKDKHPNINFKIENPPKIKEKEVDEMMMGMMSPSEKRKHDKNMKRLSKDMSRMKGNNYGGGGYKVPNYVKGTLTRKLYEENALTKEWWKGIINKILLTEGGAAGHMNHPFDDRELTFGEMKELVKLSLQGKLNVESDVTEKTDGQNLAVTYKNGKVGAARNKSTIKEPMSIDAVAAKFEGRGDIKDAFVNSMTDLENALKELDEDTLNNVFQKGTNFLNMEIIYPATKNVITYGPQAYLQFHGLDKYDLETAKKIKSSGVPDSLKNLTQNVNTRNQDTFEIIPPKVITTKAAADFDKKEPYFLNQIEKLQKEYSLSDDDPVLTYHEKWWEENIDKKFPNVTEEEKDALVRRWASFKKDYPLRKIADETTRQAVIEYDKQEFKQINKQNVYKFEKIFLELGVDVLSNVDNYLAVNPKESVKELRKDIQSVIKQIKDSKDLDVLKKLEYQLKRIQDIGGFDKLVPSEGIVFTYKGKTYKLTGLFAPVNQLLGLTKYV